MNSEDSTSLSPTAVDPSDKRTQRALTSLLASLTSQSFGTNLINQVLGPQGLAAVSSRNPGAAQFYADNGDYESGCVEHSMVSGITLRTPLPLAAWSTFVADTNQLIDSRVLRRTQQDDGTDLYSLTIDISPVTALHHGDPDVPREFLVINDQDASMSIVEQGRDHVPGVGNAPRSLLNVIPPLEDAGAGQRILDLGTGSGVIALALKANYPKAHVIGTDVSARALGFAAVGEPGVADGIEWRKGSWFEPVADETFDVIVSNPPFVIGPGLGFVYRETSMEMDGASELVVREAQSHLAIGGHAHLLAAWTLQEGECGAHKVSSWIDSDDIQAWIVQREEVDIATYVDTWLRDESIDPRTADGQARTREWLEYFADKQITRVGMGYVHLQRNPNLASSVTFEVMDQALQPGTYLGTETAEWFTRHAWLESHTSDDLLDSSFAVRPGVALEDIRVADTAQSQGFVEHALRISRTEGPAWTHDIDEHLAAVVKGLNPDGLSLRDTAGLYSAINGFDDDAFATAIAPLIVDLVRHGIVLPKQLLEEL